MFAHVPNPASPFSLTKPPQPNKIQAVVNFAPPRGGVFSATIMTEENKPAETHPQVTNLSQVDVGTIHAELVRMHQSIAETVNSEDVELNISGAVAVNARNVKVQQSLLLAVEAEEMNVDSGVVAVAQAETLSLNGAAGVAVAGSVDFGNAYAGVVAAREVRGERIESIILLSPKVEGNVTTVMDTRGALIAGMVGGLFAGIMLLLGRMLFGRKR